MKIILISIFISGIIGVGRSESTFQNKLLLVKKDTAKSLLLSPLLTQYLDLKEALVNSDPNQAATSAGLMLKEINSINESSLEAKDQKLFSSLKNKLALDARHISEVKDINHQREHFASLSLNMYQLAKGTKLSDYPVYKDYCPMKKSYWLSAEEDIKNPYYGKQMLNCGSIKETLK